MPPLRRYLRVTRSSVLEVRIHLDHPSNTSWLLDGANAALPRIIAAVRPLLLQNLRDGLDRGGGSKAAARNRQVKDVITEGAWQLEPNREADGSAGQATSRWLCFWWTRRRGTRS
jgi:hypothetical protein